MPAKKEKPEILGEKCMKDEIRSMIADFLLSASEHFIQLHGGRGVGKTYTTQKTIISDCLMNGRQFILTVPTLKQKESGALKKWTSKVLDLEFPAWQRRTTFQYLYMRRCEEDDWQLVGQCQALSMAEQDKIDSSVHEVDWMVWDEAMKINLDPGTADLLLELFLAAYHTVDRDENRVKAVFLGNALNKLDPLYGFFGVGIPDLKKPGLVKRTFNRVSWFVPMPPDLNDDPENAFRKMISGTKYGNVAAGQFDLSYGYLIGDPGQEPVTTCLGIEFTEDSYLLLMMSGRTVYIQACGKKFAETYAQKIYCVSFKDATRERRCVPRGVINTIRLALSAGCCKFVDEESLLTGASRLKACWNIPVL